VAYGTDPLLRRPLSIHRITSPDSLRFLYRESGRGTNILSRLVPGDQLDALGPLGNGFKVGKTVKHALIVGGGIGVAPLLCLTDHIAKERPDITQVVFIGGRDKDSVMCLDQFKELGIETHIRTEDGSIPKKGLITHSLEEYIDKYKKDGTGGWAIYSCGPTPMLRSVAAIANKHGITCFTSLEAHMACGIGACLGCVIPLLDREHETQVYRKVCEDGPVFDSEEVLW
jgi:dihydroorotate dehydrogenase electron transfer subunit